jgi:hypothetical protein
MLLRSRMSDQYRSLLGLLLYYSELEGNVIFMERHAAEYIYQSLIM